MFALRVVEELDVVEHVLAGFFSGFVFSATDAFAFEQVEEALHHRIVPAVPAAAHAWDQIVLLKELLPLMSGELGALVGMHMELGVWVALNRPGFAGDLQPD